MLECRYLQEDTGSPEPALAMSPGKQPGPQAASTVTWHQGREARPAEGPGEGGLSGLASGRPPVAAAPATADLFCALPPPLPLIFSALSPFSLSCFFLVPLSSLPLTPLILFPAMAHWSLPLNHASSSFLPALHPPVSQLIKCSGCWI